MYDVMHFTFVLTFCIHSCKISYVWIAHVYVCLVCLFMFVLYACLNVTYEVNLHEIHQHSVLSLIPLWWSEFWITHLGAERRFFVNMSNICIFINIITSWMQKNCIKYIVYHILLKGTYVVLLYATRVVWLV